MAKKTSAPTQPEPTTENPPETHKEGFLKTTAAALGSAVGTVAALASSVRHHDAPLAPAKKSSGRLPKKNKTRLPRRQKKELAKQNAVQA